jgi:hypothetical protein
MKQALRDVLGIMAFVVAVVLLIDLRDLRVRRRDRWRREDWV